MNKYRWEYRVSSNSPWRTFFSHSPIEANSEEDAAQWLDVPGAAELSYEQRFVLIAPAEPTVYHYVQPVPGGWQKK